jgi:hypothetical protein
MHTLNAETVAALNAFAQAEGRRWKSRLAEVYWYNARIWIAPDGTQTHGTALHRLRNTPGGHAALATFKPT